MGFIPTTLNKSTLHVRTLRRLSSMRVHIPQSMATSITPQSGMLLLQQTISSPPTMRETTHSVRICFLHVLILRALEELVNLGEELVLSDLIVEALKDLINWSEVGLNLVLDVLVHELLLGVLAAAHEALDLAH